MKKGILFTFLATILFLLTGCSEPMVSESGYDLEALEECVDAMIDEDSNQACDTTVKDTIIEEYSTSFMEEFAGENTQYTDSNLTYSQNKDGSIERIEFWFQFANLPSGIAQTEYETFKSIIQTMSLELRAMNDVPEFIFTGEFLFMDDIAYKYHHDLNDDISGDLIVWGMQTTFQTTYLQYETFFLEKANDEELKLQEITIVNNDHNVKISIDPMNGTYSYQIYYTADEAVMSTTEVESIIETSFDTISFPAQD
jgi:hypothetical protein